ncbi:MULTISPECIES: RES family NAD+ phosphorylase [Streptomyces]|uniref:RES family NAD+ phosphorylase n=1 Tax=Streptomyces TaxID=1883 RepID=UPI002FDBCC83
MRATRELPRYTASTIGSTPNHRATSNRLSPAGTSLFYGSADPATAVSEISAHDGRPFAAVAAFETTRAVTMVDLVDVDQKAGDPAPAPQSAPGTAMEFVLAFARGISVPVRRDGRERLEYAPTQIITEYFRHLSPLRADGIRFHSAQNHGVNYVLFVGPEGCTDSLSTSPCALLRLVPGTEHVRERAGLPG